MTKKLKVNPKISYLLGLYNYNKGNEISVTTRNIDVIHKFAKISMEELGIAQNELLTKEVGNETQILFYNSKLRKMFDASLERKDKIFKYKNEYSANYFAGIFDAIGGRDRKGLYLNGLETTDYLILENLGIHFTSTGKKYYSVSTNTFVLFIKGLSVRISSIVG